MSKAWMLAAALLVATGAAAAAAALTPEQREEVVQVMRQALHDDPSILRDALVVLQRDEAGRQSEAASDAIDAQHAALVADAADPVIGNPAGSKTVVEFYDPRCPYCRQMLPVLAALVQADPQVRLVLKDIPILGPASVLEARALLAAQRQGGYAVFQAAIMGSQTTPTVASLRAEAAREGLDGARLERDMADPAIQARLDRNLQLASLLHIEGTPALVIGNHLIPGAVDLAELRTAIDAPGR